MKKWRKKIKLIENYKEIGVGLKGMSYNVGGKMRY